MNTATLRHIQILAWEFWTLSWKQLVFAIACSLAITMIIYGILPLSIANATPPRVAPQGDGQFASDFPDISMQFGFFWIVLMLAGSAVIPALGKPAQRHRLPSSSLVLVGVPLLFSLLTTVTVYAVVAVTLNTVFGVNWVFWGPAMFAAAAVAWSQAVFWTTSNSNGLAMLVGLSSTIAIIFLGHGVENEYASIYATCELSLPLLVGYLSVIGVSLAIATLGFSRLRHGRGLPVARFIDWMGRLVPQVKTLVTTLASMNPLFSSPTSAQLWYEFRSRGFVLPAAAFAVSIAAFAVSVVLGSPFAESSLGFGTALLAIFVPTFGMYFGPRTATGAFGNFLGSRPLTDSQLGNAVLKSTTISYALTLAIWLVTATIIHFAVLRGSWSEMRSALFADGPGVINIVAVFALGWALGWSAIGWTTSATLGPRMHKVLLGVLVTVATFAFVASNTWLDDRSRSICYFILGIVFAVLVIAAFARSYQLKLIGRPTMLLALAILPLVLVAIMFASKNSGRTLEAATWLVIISAFVPAPLALAPLAVWSNRHR